MNYFKLTICILFFASVLIGCKQHEQARRPISQASGSFMKKSVDRNKKLVASEEDIIKKIIQNNPKIKYYATRKGYWLYYDERNETDPSTPKKGDIAYFDLEIKDIEGIVIYSASELGPQTYQVDKQEIMMGLRDGIKLMRKNETVTFLFPSHIAYGYHGDNKKIGPNQSLICTVSLRNFVPEPTPKPNVPTAPTITAPPTHIETKKDTLTP